MFVSVSDRARRVRASSIAALVIIGALASGCKDSGGGPADGGSDDGSMEVAVTGVTLDRDTANIALGSEGITLVATVAPATATNKAVTWSSSDDAVATVSASGLVSPVAPGTSTITVTTVDGSMTASCTVTVTPVAVTGVSLDAETINLATGGESVTLVASITPANATNTAVTWESSDTSVATVSAEGVVTAVDVGTATITVTTEDGGFTDTAEAIVTVPVTGVMLSTSTLAKTVGDASSTLVATVTPETANANVTWSSSAPEVATVSESGEVAPVASGTTTITVTTEDGGFMATAVVTVSPDAVTSVTSTAPRTGQLVVSWDAATDAHATGVEVSMTNEGGGTNLPVQTVASGTNSVVLSGLSFPEAYTISLRTLGAASTTSSAVEHEATTAQVVHIISNAYMQGPGRMVFVDTNGSGGVETHDTVIAQTDEAIPTNYRWVLWPGLAAPNDPTTVSFENQRYDAGTTTWVSTGRFAYVSNMGKPANNGQWYGWSNPDPDTNTVYTAPDDTTPAFRGTATFIVEPGAQEGSLRFRQYSDTTRALLHTYYHCQAQTAATVGGRFDADSSWFLEALDFRTP